MLHSHVPLAGGFSQVFRALPEFEVAVDGQLAV